MKRIVVIAFALGVLASCGADGEPVKPSINTNVGVGTNGVNAHKGVRVGKGPFSVGVRLGL